MLFYFYFGMRLIVSGDLSTEAQAGLWTVLSIAFGFVLWFFLFRTHHHARGISKTHERMVQVSHLAIAFLSFLLVVTLLRDLILLLAIPFGPLGSQYEVLTVLVLSAALLVFGLFNAKYVRIKRITLPIENLPLELHGFRIAQISDLHIGSSIGETFVNRVVKKLNTLNADLVTMTGDLVDGRVVDHRNNLRLLSQIRSLEGCFYVTGNHEYYWGAEAWIAEFEKIGIVTLINSHRVVSRGSARLIIAGIPDAWVAHHYSAHKADPKAALRGAPESSVRILLSHQPTTARSAEQAGYNIQLSGHTHGGQFIPWTFLARFFHPFTRGIYRFGKLWLYVNSGTGFWGPPVRLGSPCEVTLFTLANA